MQKRQRSEIHKAALRAALAVTAGLIASCGPAPAAPAVDAPVSLGGAGAPPRGAPTPSGEAAADGQALDGAQTRHRRTCDAESTAQDAANAANAACCEPVQWTGAGCDGVADGDGGCSASARAAEAAWLDFMGCCKDVGFSAPGCSAWGPPAPPAMPRRGA